MIRIQEDGQRFSGETFTETVSIEAWGTEFDRCHFGAKSPWLYGVQHREPWKWGPVPPVDHFTVFRDCVSDGAKSAGMLLQHSIIQGGRIERTGKDGLWANSGGNLWVRGVHILSIGDRSIDPGNEADRHADAFQTSGASNLFFEENVFDMLHPLRGGPKGHDSNSCLMIQTNVNQIQNVHAWRNVFRGGNYATYVRKRNHGVPRDVSFRENLYIAGSWSTGPVSFDGHVDFDESNLLVPYDEFEAARAHKWGDKPPEHWKPMRLGRDVRGRMVATDERS